MGSNPLSTITTVAQSGMMQYVIDVDAERTGDLLASERARAMAGFRRKYGIWPDTKYQTVDGEPAYPKKEAQ